MPNLTLGEAAKRTKKSKATILNAIKKGRISAKKNDVGVWQIDPAELHRVYPIVSLNSSINTKTERGQTPSNTNKNSKMEREIELLNERLEEKDKTIEDLRAERDDWRKESEDWKRQATALLTDQRPKSPEDRPGKWDIVVVVMLLLAVGLLASQYYPALRELFIR